jgi:hypothetical protein
LVADTATLPQKADGEIRLRLAFHFNGMTVHFPAAAKKLQIFREHFPRLILAFIMRPFILRQNNK